MRYELTTDGGQTLSAGKQACTTEDGRQRTKCMHAGFGFRVLWSMDSSVKVGGCIKLFILANALKECGSCGQKQAG